MGRIIPYFMENKKNVPNHQPNLVAKSHVLLGNRFNRFKSPSHSFQVQGLWADERFGLARSVSFGR